ncbi:MAG TPA: hypothetical protein VMF06_23455 [Candidatus Limnocylindria bacterium]|jgi:hypothetical protein|nr:hypothetical protein [Candidatus Limnocylindria bacterium]
MLNPRRKKALIYLGALCLLILAFIPLPLSPTSGDKERVVAHALDALLEDRGILTSKGYVHLLDTGFVKGKDRIYFENNLGIPDTVFLKHGLKPIPKDRRLNVDQGDVVVGFSEGGAAGTPAATIEFSYVFGSLGAQGYEIRVYKSLFKLYCVYIHRWVS